MDQNFLPWEILGPIEYLKVALKIAALKIAGFSIFGLFWDLHPKIKVVDQHSLFLGYDRPSLKRGYFTCYFSHWKTKYIYWNLYFHLTLQPVRWRKSGCMPWLKILSFIHNVSVDESKGFSRYVWFFNVKSNK